MRGKNTTPFSFESFVGDIVGLEPDQQMERALEAKRMLLGDIQSIKSQLDAAKSKAFTDGIYADSEWFTKARHALRCKSYDYQCVQELCGKLRRQVNEDKSGRHTKEFHSEFIKVVKSRVPEVDYLSFVEEANRRVQEQSS